ncbi:hypothetical protein [Streptomyces sp. TLI_146]|uniref:hypothetical protein n=1 Tax=Streptomyces sp. TLI_146 TaxID=1938858 RepID=UPI000C70A0B2|nr:hypothetical protein [Streptomyces sp. TLI_146]PKV88284.1 hypothetical protein BX283_5895 [Streptomyces sp. TLI_146]
MVSRASSDRAVPAGPHVVRLPVVGTSWYRRGFGYWARRIALGAFVLLVMAVMLSVLLIAFGDTVNGLPGVWPPVLWIAMVALCAGSAVWGWVRARRQMREKLAEAASPEESWKAHRGRQRQVGSGLSSPWRALVLLALPFLAPLFAWLLGTLCAATFVRELPSEVGARRAMAR